MLHRLVYIGDVPVEASYHGSALLYRLLSEYPADDLTIVETGTRSAPDRRLPHVTYEWTPLAKARWMNTRFHPYVVTYYSALAKGRSADLLAKLNNVQFSAVLTVAHGFGWLTAAELAESRGVPLHLIVHDDWTRLAHVPGVFRPWLDRRFGETYRQAQSRMCVSPAMRDSYRERYGCEAEVLFPMRDKACPQFDAPATRVATDDHPFTIAFAGSINSTGYIQALKRLSTALDPIGGRLLIFGPLTISEAASAGLDRPNIVLGGLLKPSDLIDKLRQEADALFVPMSFAEADRANMQTAFPSKLADYSAVGAPMLIYGPEYCSAVRWARENDDVAIVVTRDEEGALTDAVGRLAASPADRLLLGARALDIGRKYFAHEKVQSVFIRALTSAVPSQILTGADYRFEAS